MEIDDVGVISFDDIAKEQAPKKEEEKKEEQNKEQTNPENGLISFDDLAKQVEEEPKDPEAPRQTKASNPEVLTLTLQALYDKEGIEFKPEEFDGTIESFLELQEKLSDEKAQAKLTSHIETNLNPLNKKFVELVDEGVSEEDAGSLIKMLKQVQSIDKGTISEDLSAAEKVYRSYLKATTNFSDTKIEREIKGKKEAGTLLDEAEETYDELVRVIENYEEDLKREAEANAKAVQYRQRENAKRLQDFLESTEEIAGITLTKPLKEKWLKEYQTVEANGQRVNPIFATRAEDPDKFDALMRFYHSIGLFKYDKKKKDFMPDLSVLKAVNKKDVVKDLEKAIKASADKGIASSFGTSVGDYDMEQVVNDGFNKLKKLAEKQKQ